VPFGVGFPELVVVLVVLLLVFGAKRLPEMGRSIGKGMREFKDAVSGDDDPTPTSTATPTTATTPGVELPSAPTVPTSPSESESERQTVS
jgi:sec-independent protein translocase protein TatA